MQPSSNNASRLLRFLIFVLKVLRDVASLMLFDNFDHTLGPRYLIVCLPYFTELNLSIVKSDCLKLYVLGLLLKKSQR